MFMEISGVCFKTEFVVEYEFKVFVNFHDLDCQAGVSGDAEGI